MPTWLVFNRTKEEWLTLLRRHNALALLNLIAIRTRNKPGADHHGRQLKEGAATTGIGDAAKLGLTPKAYRYAREELLRMGQLEIVRAIRGANGGTIVKLGASCIYENRKTDHGYFGGRLTGIQLPERAYADDYETIPGALSFNRQPTEISNKTTPNQTPEGHLSGDKYFGGGKKDKTPPPTSSPYPGGGGQNNLLGEDEEEYIEHEVSSARMAGKIKTTEAKFRNGLRRKIRQEGGILIPERRAELDAMREKENALKIRQQEVYETCSEWRLDSIPSPAWEATKNALKNLVPERDFHTWLAPMGCEMETKEALTIAAPDRFWCSWVADKYQITIIKAMNLAGYGHLKLRITDQKQAHGM